MFNGIIYNKGLIKNIIKNNKSLYIEVLSKVKFNKSEIGSSVNCNGVCLTLTSIKKRSIFFYISPETLKKTNFGNVTLNDEINIEKSLSFGQKISGHYTQGHIDVTGKIKSIKIIDKTWIINILTPKQFQKFLMYKASISINGVSLTISKVNKIGFEVAIIPHTLTLTNLRNLKKNTVVNVEFDIFSKYLVDLDN